MERRKARAKEDEILITSLSSINIPVHIKAAFSIKISWIHLPTISYKSKRYTKIFMPSVLEELK